jgi:very-short-patch-repair endonuclease
VLRTRKRSKRTRLKTARLAWRELDGTQHLADPVAYRRDRSKDQLLQQNGYIGLRFLVEDLARHLDAILDAILRSFVHRRH